ncbi:hypothetical protein M430DRAFT_36058 [Amorphotheca resinae ATCC 22711]|uniref:Uncharacterized protein n=1 Tax=Amorphotheca resinae ATCC 22711 TaxID=857342 RepID=A0A2T3AVU4_AMORE|nr:hypothetical protein M430DRAFT_36058 [Amorphotheca resinae ATCC 22711]PSS12796.1 hypothetical protein M430DRAFT_36058 [Amorphotheca resinae ATCC 22711]
MIAATFTQVFLAVFCIALSAVLLCRRRIFQMFCGGADRFSPHLAAFWLLKAGLDALDDKNERQRQR